VKVWRWGAEEELMLATVAPKKVKEVAEVSRMVSLLLESRAVPEVMADTDTMAPEGMLVGREAPTYVQGSVKQAVKKPERPVRDTWGLAA